MALSPGTRLGPYEILAPVGAGGMGEVYRARDTRLGRDVAIKVLPQHLATSPEDRARFAREAKTISALNHPHICVLHDVGREGDTDFLVMELIEGETLARRIARGPLPTAEVLQIGAQVADALDRAHRAGVVHRDLKPSNIMLTKSGAKLMDFGLARGAKPGSTGPETLTRTAGERASATKDPITAKGTVVGTYQYMSPEQLEGNRADARSDLWALGCVLYEMATGKRAFEGSTPASIISAIMRDQPREMETLSPLAPPMLQRIVNACLEKDPEDRIQSAHDAKLQLEWLRTAGSRTDTAIVSSLGWWNSKRLGWATAGVAVLLAGLGWIGPWRDASGPETRVSSKPLTFRPLTIFSAGFAPDGETVLLSAATSGNAPAIFVLRPERPDAEVLTERGVHFLDISSKGELAVLTNARYRSYPEFVGTLARMPLGGGAPRELQSEVHDADWSPDGTELAIVRGWEGKVRLEYPIGRVLHETGTGYLTEPRVSPLGDRVAFFQHPTLSDNGGSVVVVDLHGKSVTVVRDCRLLSGLTWDANGRDLLFSGRIAGDEVEVFRATLTGRVSTLYRSAGGQRIHDVNRAGTLLTTRDDTRLRVMIHRDEWGNDRDYSWLEASQNGQLSADGSTIVFTESSEALGERSAVCLRRLDGSPQIRISEGANCGFSPDGNWVVALQNGTPAALTLQPTGVGEPRLLPPGAIETFHWTRANWFPTGESLLVVGQERGARLRIYLQDIRGGEPRRLSIEAQHQSAIAPDGSWVVTSGGAGKFLHRFDGTPPESLRVFRRGDQLLPWVPDHRSVLVVPDGAIRQIPLRIYRVDLRTGARSAFRTISPSDSSGLIECSITGFSRDLKTYAYDATTVLSSLFAITVTNSDRDE